jgi:hypothetical protein
LLTLSLPRILTGRKEAYIMPKRTKAVGVPVTERALVQRINRKLKADGELLKKCREDSPSYHNLGDWFLIDVTINGVIGTDIDIVEKGRELGVLKPWERLQEDE